MQFRKLLAIMLVYSTNFHVMHWNAKGKSFDRIHEKCGEFYEHVYDDCDVVAELAMRVGQRAVGYYEAYEILKEENDSSYVILSSNRDIDFDIFIKLTKLLFTTIMKQIINVLEDDICKDIRNVGIKSTLESMYEWYDLQTRYLNERRFD